nr:DUF2927 domain-containing protein [Defluviimonas aquaemixtae]
MVRRLLVISLAAALLGACSGPKLAPEATRAVLPELPPMQNFAATRADIPRRSNTAMAQDFVDLTFQLESGRPLPVLTRFEGPVRVRLAGTVPPTASTDLARLLARLRNEAGLDIALAHNGQVPQITVEFLPRASMQRFVPRAACFVAPRVGSWEDYRRARRDTLDWATLTVRKRAAIFIPNDTAPQEIRDCLHEELAQALGPLNDLYSLSDSVFNDDNIHTVLTGFDMLMLRVTYDPELRSGMTASEVAARVPGILSRLNPRGIGVGGRASDPTPRDYANAIETALGPGTLAPRRRAAAKRAVDIALARGWRDARAGFAWLALGRLSLGHDARQAEAAFAQASKIYHRGAGLALQAAHADMQLAAFALSEGRAEDVLALTESALPEAAGAENAALLSSLLMLRAEALDLVGRASEARQVRLDSLAWGRYGFASDAEVVERVLGIAALSSASRTGHP